MEKKPWCKPQMEVTALEKDDIITGSICQVEIPDSAGGFSLNPIPTDD